MQRKLTWWMHALIGLVSMILCAVLIIFGTTAIRDSLLSQFEKPLTNLPQIASTAPLSLDGTAAAQYHVQLAENCLDAAGAVVAYRIQVEQLGYNQDYPITLAVTVTKDGTGLIGIEVLDQNESEYFGARIATAEFAKRFEARVLPLFLTGEAGRGAHVDGISGATITSKAVVDMVNNAAQFAATLQG